MSLFEELIEDKEKDKEIVKSFESKDSLPDTVFSLNNGKYELKDEIRKKQSDGLKKYISSLSSTDIKNLYQDMLPDLIYNRNRFFEFAEEEKLRIYNIFRNGAE